jgi:hypothetical protein
MGEDKRDKKELKKIFLFSFISVYPCGSVAKLFFLYKGSPLISSSSYGIILELAFYPLLTDLEVV